MLSCYTNNVLQIHKSKAPHAHPSASSQSCAPPLGFQLPPHPVRTARLLINPSCRPCRAMARPIVHTKQAHRKQYNHTRGMQKMGPFRGYSIFSAGFFRRLQQSSLGKRHCYKAPLTIAFASCPCTDVRSFFLLPYREEGDKFTSVPAA